jgi:uncharacterized protein
VIALDTNVLVAAHRDDSLWHASATKAVNELVSQGRIWGIPVACLSEFLSVVTGIRGVAPPTPVETAIEQVQEWLGNGGGVILHSGQNHAQTLFDLALAAKIRGGQFHDARIAAICIENGVTELWTADRDFSRFPQLKTRNPLVMV